MTHLSEEQLNNLNKDALIIIVSSLQSQLEAVQAQLESSNSMLAENMKKIDLLTEQIRLMNQRHFGRKTESSLNEDDSQLTLFELL